MIMYTRTVVVLLILLVGLAACGPAVTPVLPSPTAPSTPSPTPLPLTPAPAPRTLAFGTAYSDVHYCTDGSTPLRLNLLVPNLPTRSPAPVLIHLKFQAELIRPLVARGFIVASVDWREPPDDKLPTGIEDVKCAIRYLRANAAQYNLDPDRIGVFGCSRGGHVAAMVGVTDTKAEMEGQSGFANESSRVQAVVMFDGIADFGTNYADARGELESVHGITSLDHPLVASFSPITYVTEDDPPFLLIASAEVHWQNQAQQLAEVLRAKDISTTYLPVQAGHCQYPETGPNSLDNMIKIIGDFFEQALK
jgi:acetyl esterase/lipase